jgi:hypothetical protein
MILLHGICRAVDVKLKWLLGFLLQCFESLPALPEAFAPRNP